MKIPQIKNLDNITRLLDQQNAVIRKIDNLNVATRTIDLDRILGQQADLAKKIEEAGMSSHVRQLDKILNQQTHVLREAANLGLSSKVLEAHKLFDQQIDLANKMRMADFTSHKIQLDKILNQQTHALREAANLGLSSKVLEAHKLFDQQIDLVNKMRTADFTSHKVQLDKILNQQTHALRQVSKISLPSNLIDARKLFSQQSEAFKKLDKLNTEKLFSLSHSVLTGLIDTLVEASNDSTLHDEDIVAADNLFDINVIEQISEESTDPEEFFLRLVSYLQVLGKKYGTKAVALIFTVLIIPYFVSVMASWHTPMYQEWWEQYQNTEPRKAKKEIRKEANSLYAPHDLKYFRFVFSSSGLNVRDYPSRDSVKLDCLPLGTVVKPIAKLKAWTLVEYLDIETDEIKQGWVFSRYLQKFN